MAERQTKYTRRGRVMLSNRRVLSNILYCEVHNASVGGRLRMLEVSLQAGSVIIDYKYIIALIFIDISVSEPLQLLTLVDQYHEDHNSETPSVIRAASES